MKPIIITSKSIKKEFYIWLVLFVCATLLNVYSIVKYHTNWSELYSQLGYVLAISIVFYVVIGVVRVLMQSVKLFKK